MSDKQRISKVQPVKPGYLPIREFTSPLSAASSPFGDDVHFPLAQDKIEYEHAEPQPERIDRPAS